MTPRAVPQPPVARAPALQWVRILAGPLGHQLRPRQTHGLVHLDVLQVDGPGLLLQAEQVRPAGEPAPLHPVQRPEQIDRCGAAAGQRLLGLSHAPREVRRTGIFLGGQHHRVGRRHADGRRAPDHHGPDGLSRIPVVGIAQPVFRAGQTGLVQQIELIPFPADRLHRKSLISI